MSRLDHVKSKLPELRGKAPFEAEDASSDFTDPGLPIECSHCGREVSHESELNYGFYYSCVCGTQAIVFKDNSRVVVKLTGESKFHAPGKK